MTESHTQQAPQLPRFYEGRELLITGGTGFMGKVLVERLLATCPEVRRVHLLMRPKQGHAPDERLARLKSSQVFDNIRARCPHQLDKLVAVAGDVTQPLLGLDDGAIAELKQVSVVFHNAATVKLWVALHEAVSQNVLSAIHAMDLCDKLPALEALVHVSTAYTNAELPYVEERVYETGVKLPDLLALLDTNSEDTVQHSKPKLIQPKVNTYVFSKAVAEEIVAERKHRHYSVAIFRPSIVISSHRAPFPGWIEGLSGATGVLVTTGQGLLRVLKFKGHCRADMVPVDVVIDSMLALAWETATDKAAEARVYYCGSQENPVRWAQFHDEMLRSNVSHPMDHALYYPFLLELHNRYVFKVLQVLLQTVPMYVAELLSRVCGRRQRTSFITVAKRLSAMSDVLSDFTSLDITFGHDNMRRLRDKLLASDGHLFHLDVRVVDWQEHILNFQRGARKYLLGQKDEDLPSAKEHMNRLRLLHYVVLLCLAISTHKLLVFLAHKLARAC